MASEGGAAASAHAFSSLANRSRDGDVLLIQPVTSFVLGRLSKKEVPTQGTLVITTHALYEFKGSAISGKETRRIPYQEFFGFVLNRDSSNRFLPLISPPSTTSLKTTKSYETENRAELVRVIQQACPSAVMSQLSNAKINFLLQALPQNPGLSWPELVSGADSGTLKLETGSAMNNADVRKSLRSTKSAPRKAPGAEASNSNTSVAAAGGDSFVSSVWDQICAATELPQTAEEIACASALANKFSIVLGSGNQPKDEVQALLAVALVFMDPILCKSFLGTLLIPRGLAQALLEDLEESLGNATGLVRRWTAAAFFASLPTFDQSNCSPASSGWLAASRLHSEQVRVRESALPRLLFPPLAKKKASKATTTMGSGGEEEEDNDSEATEMASPSLAAMQGNGAMPRIGLGLSITGSKKMTTSSTTAMSAPKRRASNMLTSLMSSAANVAAAAATAGGGGGNFTINEEEFGEAGGGARRQRATLSLVWLSRLLDLEDVAASTNSTGRGILKADVQTLFQFLLGKTPDAASEDARSTEFEVETFGANVEFPEFFAPILASLTATRNEDVRCIGLKQLNVLLMRNNAAMRSIVSVPDWQSIIFATLYNVPLLPANRTSTQDDTYSYTMHMVTMIHLSVLGSKSHCSEFGPIDKLFGQTIYKLAVNSGWGEPTVSVVRSLFKGLFSTLAKQASSPTCAWRYNPMYDEWEEIFRLSHLLQTFLFYRPTNMALRDISETVARASKEASSNLNLGPFTDWRARVKHQPLLNRVQNERLATAHRQMFAKLNLPVMTAAHRGDEIGIHLDENGMCHDRSLVETAVKLWTALGISGNEAQDRKKAEELSSKQDKSRVLYASNVCRELTEVLRLFDIVDEKRSAVLKAAYKMSMRKGTSSLLQGASPPTPLLSLDNTGVKSMSSQQRDQLSAIAHSKTQDFLYKQKTKEQNVGFLSKAKPKNMANLNLRQNLLQRRHDVVRKLGSGSETLRPQIVPAPQVLGSKSTGQLLSRDPSNRSLESGGNGPPPLAQSKSFKLHIRADQEMTAVPPPTHRQSSLEETSVFEAAMRTSSAGDAPIPPRKTLIHLKPTTATSPQPPGSNLASPKAANGPNPSKPSLISIPDSDTVNALLEVAEEEDQSPARVHSFELVKKRSRAAMCYGCDRPILGEFDEVQKFGHVWHAECLICSNCSKLVIFDDDKTSAAAAGSQIKFFPNAELLLCSADCQNEVLNRDRDKRCAGCLDNLAAGDEIVSACGRNFHVQNQCFRCTSCDLAFDSTRPYFEVEGSSYCASCIDNKYRKCKRCAELLLETDKVVEAQDWQYHDRCFTCNVCKDPFGEDNYFVGQQEGELLCYTHHLAQRTPPCACCHLPFNPKVESDAPVTIAGLNFHRNCLQCSKCSRKLVPLAEPGSDEAAEEHDGLLFCTDCYVEEFGLECHRCKTGIKGDVLHAGIGKHGETINWHPECFCCTDCALPLLEIPFFLVSVGEADLVTVCSEHYHARYSNRTCPGCNGFVSPGRNRVDDEEAEDAMPLLPGMPRPVALTRTASFTTWENSNPAVMFEDKMWHARCLTCEAPNCHVGLYEDFSSTSPLAATTQFRVQTNHQGQRVCQAHFLEWNKCFTCQQPFEEEEDRTEVMDWVFHDRPECFRCADCLAPIEQGQALVKQSNGPVHQKCPSGLAQGNKQPAKRASIIKRMSLSLGLSSSSKN